MTAAPTFEQLAAQVLGRLQQATGRLLTEAPGALRRAKDVEHAFRVDSKLAWRVHGIATAKNPLAAGSDVPARVSMNRFLRSARKLGLPEGAIGDVEESFERFEKLVEEHAGDRERFASMVGGLVREEGDELNLKQKKAAFRAASHLRGYEVRAYTSCAMFYPGKQPGSLDTLLITCRDNLLRLRASAPVLIPIGRMNLQESTDKEAAGEPTIHDFPVRSLLETDGGYLLEDFCSAGLSDLRLHSPGSKDAMLEVHEGVGLNRAATIAMAMVSRDVPMPPTEPLVITPGIHHPTETLIVDAMVHRDVFAVPHPWATRVMVYDKDGMDLTGLEPEHVKRSLLLNVSEHCDAIGMGADLLSTPDSPRHVEMIKAVCERMGWNQSEFYVYRCRVEYPIMRTTVWVEIDPTGR